MRRKNAVARPFRLFENQKDVCDASLRAGSRAPRAICRRRVQRVPPGHPQRPSPGSISVTVAPQTVIFIRIFGSLSIFAVHVKGHHYGGGDLFGRARMTRAVPVTDRTSLDMARRSLAE